MDDEFDILMEDSLNVELLEEMKVKLYLELDNLSEQSRKVFESIVFENMKYKEVADELGLSLNTIKTHLSRALKQLRSTLNTIVVIMLTQS